MFRKDTLFIETESRLVVAWVWGGRRDYRQTGLYKFEERLKGFTTELCWWLHNSINLLQITELYTYNGWIFVAFKLYLNKAVKINKYKSDIEKKWVLISGSITKIQYPGNSLVVQWLGLHAFTAEGAGSVPGWGTNIPQAEWHSQKKKKKKIQSPWCEIKVFLNLPYIFYSYIFKLHM